VNESVCGADNRSRFRENAVPCRDRLLEIEESGHK
jgi:hypothetical protein